MRCKPVHVTHGEQDAVRSAAPPCYKVQSDVLLVHKGHTYKEKGVWFYVYEGSLRDCMLSKTLLSTIRSKTAPDQKLVDLDPGSRDDSTVQQLVSDMKSLEEKVFVNFVRSAGTPKPSDEATGKRPKLNANAPRLQDIAQGDERAEAEAARACGKALQCRGL